MSGEIQNKKSIINIELPDSIDNAVNNLTDKPTATIGETISDCLFLVFGCLNQKAAIKRVKYSVELENFKKELEEKINTIPEENREDVNTHTVCTALDNMRYCVEEKELRDMFTCLIANSINSEKSHAVHPAYGEIIKQLTSFDALVLKNILSQAALPILTINIQLGSNGGESPLAKNLLWSTFENPKKISSTLDNLERLKLINITYEKHYTKESHYENLKRQIHIASIISQYSSMLQEGNTLTFSKGVIEITDFGGNFYSACS